MDIAQLARELKERQIKAGYVAKEIILALSNKEIIVSYLICSHCKKWLITYDEALELTKRCKNSDEFLEKVEEIGRGC